MIGMEFIVPVAAFAFSTLITPGPNNIIIATAGVNFGFRHSLPTILGVSVGFSTMVLLVSWGIGNVIMDYPMFHKTLRVLSLIFMLYLAWKIATANVKNVPADAQPPGFWYMVFFQWINPKAWAMCTGVAAAFISASSEATRDAVLIAGIFLCISLPCQSTWGIFGSTIGSVLRSNIAYLKIFNVSMATLMLLAFIPAITF